MTQRHAWTIVLMAMVWTLSACGSGARTVDLSTVTVETVLSDDLIEVGGSFSVECIVTDKDGNVVNTDTVFEVAPGTGVTIDGATVTIDKTGEYAVICMLPGGAKADESPGVALVTTGGVASVETTLDSAEVNAGQDVHVTCEVQDMSGEILDWDTELIVTPTDGISIEGHALKTTKDGEYLVACKAVDTPVKDTTPETLTVLLGDPATVRATIEEEEVSAGTAVEVSCVVEDGDGNPLPMEATVDPQDGLNIDGSTVTIEIAGEYTVTCSPVEDLGELEQIPDTLVVVPGELAALVLSAKPSKAAYKLDEKVAIESEVTDVYGNVLEDAAIVLTIPEGMKESGSKYEFEEEGIYAVQGHVEGHEDISDELTLVCDETGPEVIVLVPERGATLDGDVMVDIEGTAIDLFSDEVELEINGTSVPVNENGQFFHVIQATHGLNILVFEATDEYGRRTKIAQSFYYSTEYVDFNTENINDVTLPQSLLIYLGQNFLDDGIHDPTHIDDLATLVEILLGSIDLNAILDPTTPIAEFPLNDIVNYTFDFQGFQFILNGALTIRIYIENISLSLPAVSINTREGGINLHLAFNESPTSPAANVTTYIQLDFVLTASTNFGGEELLSAGLNPSAFVESSASLGAFSLDANLDIFKALGGDLDIGIDTLDIDLEGIDIDPLQDVQIELGPVVFNGTEIVQLPAIPLGNLVSGLNDIVSQYILNPILNFAETAILDFLLPIVQTQIGALLNSVLNQVEFEIPIPIPALPGSQSNVDINFKTRLDTVVFTEDGGELGLGTGFLSTKGVDRDPLGSILRMNCLSTTEPGMPEFDTSEKMELAALLDTVNELLFSLWWGNGLTLNIDGSTLGGLGLDQYGVSDMSISTEFYLPPILNDCTAKDMVEVQIGDLLLTANFKMMGAPVMAQLYLSAALDASITGNGNEIGLNILGFTDIETQIIQVQGSLLGFDIEDLIEGVVIPMLVEQVSNLALGSFPIPEFDLSGLVPGIPPGTTLGLTDLEIGMDSGYLMIGGALQ